MSNTAGGLDVGKMAMAGFGQVMDSMDLVKRAWSGFSLATPFTPTLNVEELDKRIAELRAVEQWLALNQNMLRNTIHGLEVQRGTLHAIGTMSKSFDDMTRPADDTLAQSLASFAAAAAQKAAGGTPGASGPAAPAGGFDWSPFGMPSSAFNRPHGGETGTASTPVAEAAADGDADRAAGAAAGGDNADPGAGATAGDNADPAAAPNMAAMNALAWWDMLQENFRQIAQAATGDTAAGAGTSREPAGAGPAPAKKARVGKTSASKAGASKAGASKTGAAKAGSGKTGATTAGPSGPRRRKATRSNGAP